MSDFTVMTPTGNRSIPLALCVKWMERQTVKPEQWLIVDDGTEPLPTLPSYAQVVDRYDDGPRPGHTLPLNILAGLPHVRHGKLIFMEDDDWYGPGYLQLMSDGLDRVNLFGQGRSLYYRVGSRHYKQLTHDNMASLCCTGMTAAVYPWLRWVASLGNYNVDSLLWARYAGLKQVIKPVSPRNQVGIKGLPGRAGLTDGWTYDAKAFTPDPDGAFLRQIIGDDTNDYMPFYQGLNANK